MTGRQCALVLGLLCSIAGCSLPEGKRGTSCERSTQCDDGLVCIERRCTTNLGPVASESTVPDLGGGPVGDGGADAAGDDDGG